MSTTTETAASEQAAPTTATAFVEHVNVTVTNPERTAAMLIQIFGWQIRWQGKSQMGGHSIHVGEPGDGATYLALYSFETKTGSSDSSYATAGGLNHIGVVVDDLDLVEASIFAAGYQTHSHDDYEPGRRFYFHDHDNIEFEVVSYR